MVALLSMTASFAEGENGASSKANATAVADNAKYYFNINMNSLSRTLALDFDEQDAVEYINANFSRDMMAAGRAEGADRVRLYKKAINRNLSYMHSVLSNDQYHHYVELLNTTLNNRGLNK